MTTPVPTEQDDAVIGRAFVMSMAVFGVIAVIAASLWFFLRRPEEVEVAGERKLELPEVRESAQIDFPDVSFTEVSEEWGIRFVHENGAAGGKLLPETMGSGCAALDYDSDGDLDLFFVNSQRWTAEADGDKSATLHLYRNDGAVFTDVTADVGLDVSLYGMGVAVGDVENDGDLDLFITAVGANRLFLQEEGRFRDATEAAGVAGDPATWSSSCGFFDYDRDGLLDLIVCNYVEWSPEFDLAQGFRLAGGERAYGPPKAFGGTFPYLYRNQGDGTFQDVTAKAGLHVKNVSTGVPVAKSLGVVTVDIDRDGWMDVLIANDTVRNFLFHNQRDGTFVEKGMEAGMAFDSNGRARGAMGIDVDFVRDNGELAIGIGNFSNESSALYVKQANQLLFLDEAMACGFGPPTRLELTFGLFFFDFDLDGRLDIFGANGHLENEIQKVQASQTYEQRPHLFWNRGGGTGSNEFVRVPTEVSGADFSTPIVGRGAVPADLDGDGDLDLVITQSGRPVRVLRNDQQLGNQWVQLRLEGNGTTSNRDAIGATIEAQVGERTLRRAVSRTRSYLSQSPAWITLGLGSATQVDRLTITWPDGSQQQFDGPIAGGESRVVRQP